MSDTLDGMQGRVAIVTGSGRNIGRGIAHALAARGAKVVVNGHRDRAAVDKVVGEIEAAGGEAIAAIADVGNAEEVAGMVEKAVVHFGRLDIAVSNVAIRHHQPFMEISLEDWDRTLRTNLSASFFLARAALPHMQANNWGRIVHISGRDGFRPKANRAHNVTCKAGVFALSKAIAMEFGPFGITANTVAPGVTDTVRDGKHYPNYIAEYAERAHSIIPVRRLGRAEDIAAAVCYLCGPDSGYITGQLLHVNGGEHMF